MKCVCGGALSVNYYVVLYRIKARRLYSETYLILAQWMVFLYQTIVKSQCASCLRSIVFICWAQEDTEPLPELSHLLQSEQYFSGDLNNISLAIWTIFIWWSKGDFSGDLNTISLVILTISPYDLNYNFLAIWTLFIWWSRQYLFLDSSHLSLSHFWVHFRALIWYDINEHNSQCKSAKYGENPCWRIWKQYIGWKKRVVRLMLPIKFDLPYWGFGHTGISSHQDKSYDRQSCKKFNLNIEYNLGV